MSIQPQQLNVDVEKVSVSNIVATWFIIAMLPNGIDSYIFQKPAFESRYKCVEFIVERHEILNGFVADEYNLRYPVSSKFYCVEKNLVRKIEDMSDKI